MSVKVTRVCRLCKIRQDRSNYYRNGKSASGETLYQTACKACLNIERHGERIRIRYNRCIKCEVTKTYTGDKLCSKCRVKNLTKNHLTPDHDILIKEFVDRVVEDQMMITLYDIVTIIDLFEFLPKKPFIDKYAAGRQINIMFENLMKYARTKS